MKVKFDVFAGYEMKILITGANGYIGKRLIPVLLEKKHDIYALVRDPIRLNIPYEVKKKIKVIVGDLNQIESLACIPSDIEIAYFLVHSLRVADEQFSKIEEQMSYNFLKAISKTTIRQIIYLSGLKSEKNTSRHLRSRHNVEKILKESNIATTVLRASVIIGSGSASFEIMRDLVEMLPIMIAPKWILSKAQPISIYDTIDYLTLVIDEKQCFNKSLDIGGTDILTYKQMLLILAKTRGLKRKIITVPFLTPRLSSYWLLLVTSTNFTIAKWLIDSLIVDSVCKDKTINEIFHKTCLNFKTSVKKAFSKIEENAVISKWSDSITTAYFPKNLNKYIQVPKHGCLKDIRIEKFFKDPENLRKEIWKIGGEHGWYSMNFLWKVRGLIDKLVGGVGLRRGRKNSTELEQGDIVDFWRVLLADKEKRRLLLFAEMKLPGEAWLEFKIVPHMNHYELHQIATYRPVGVLGRFYWYIMMPFHHFIFGRMCRAIVKAVS
jgi:uncharacterized protein YbjT (DUF2867 family)